MSWNWSPWSSVSEGRTTPGAPIVAVPWGDSFALFIADPGGGIYATKAETGSGWELVPGRNSTPGAQVTAVASGDRFTLFMADVNGEVFTTSGIPYQGWQPWTSVSEGSTKPGAPIAAVPWGDSFALFIADPGGGIYAIKAEPGSRWELVPGRNSTPGAQVTALASGNHFTLFMADVNGEVYATSGLPYQGWQPWTSVSEGSTKPGAPVTGVPWEVIGFALFLADPNGGIYSSTWAEVPTFTFTLDSFRITDTRSRNEDTDSVSVTLQLKSNTGNGTPQTLTKSMGNVNNGTFNVGLSFPNIKVDHSQTAVFNYVIVNSGHKSEGEVSKVLEFVGDNLAEKGLVTGGTLLGNAILPGIGGSILGPVVKWLAGEIEGIINADCDGAVAAEQVTLSYNDLLSKTANGLKGYETPHPGTDSARGCGGNSMYYVNWHIARDVNGT